jgi:integrase
MSETSKQARVRRRGDGTIHQMTNGRYEAKVSAGIDPATGRRMRKTKTFDSEAQARKWLRSLGADRDRGEIREFVSTATTVGEWMDDWLREKKSTVGPGTYEGYEQTLRKHVRPHLADNKLHSLTADHVAKWRDRLIADAVPTATVKKAMLYVSSCLNDAVKRGRIRANPCKVVKKPKHRRKDIEVFSRDEITRLIEYLRGHKYEVMFRLWLDLGCRTGELFALHWSEIDLDASKVKVVQSLEEINGKHRLKEPKTAAGRRTLTITPQTVALLRGHLESMRSKKLDVERGPLFPNSRGNFHQRNVIAKSVWRPILKSAKISYRRCYSLRHTCASVLLSSGASIVAVQRRLGHDDAAITLRTYSHLMPGDDEKSVSILTQIFGG